MMTYMFVIFSYNMVESHKWMVDLLTGWLGTIGWFLANKEERIIDMQYLEEIYIIAIWVNSG